METHKLLKRQLDKRNMNSNELPNNLNQWQKFLSSIQSTYVDVDQERYLLERSMEIFSREMMEINSKLEEAQNISNMGYWNYDTDTRLISWSKGMYKQLNLNPIKPTLSYRGFLEFVHPEDSINLKQLIEKALLDQSGYDYEMRIKIKDGTYKWFRAIAKINPNNKWTGVLINIHKEKISSENISKLHSQLLVTARLAGISEIATSILHNIGNVLNSTSVSISLIKENLEQPHQIKFFLVLGMIKENIHNITDYLLKGEKGKNIIPFLSTVTDVLKNDYQSNISEIALLEKNMTHIKDIVSMQQSISGVSGVVEKIKVLELLEHVFEISNIKQSDVVVVQEFDDERCVIISDKSKLLQILINLAQNARDSVLANKINKDKKIFFSINKTDKDTICISVKDNGVGIIKENLNLIFSFGFTTKPEGHGFGLHSAALAAKDLGGSLLAQSEGLGKGAKFSLKIPVNSLTLSKQGVLNE